MRLNPPILTEHNFILYCAKNYKNEQCQNVEEFVDDLKRIKYIRKLLTRFETTGELKERLVLNHLIVLSNVFDPGVLSRMIFLKMENQMKYIKPFMMFLNIMPERIVNVKEERVVETVNIPMDERIIQLLRKNLE